MATLWFLHANQMGTIDGIQLWIEFCAKIPPAAQESVEEHIHKTTSESSV
jgi:hypothetical protein